MYFCQNHKNVQYLLISVCKTIHLYLLIRQKLSINCQHKPEIKRRQVLSNEMKNGPPERTKRLPKPSGEDTASCCLSRPCHRLSSPFPSPQLHPLHLSLGSADDWYAVLQEKPPPKTGPRRPGHTEHRPSTGSTYSLTLSENVKRCSQYLPTV